MSRGVERFDRRLLVLTYPRDRWATRALTALQNCWRRRPGQTLVEKRVECSPLPGQGRSYRGTIGDELIFCAAMRDRSRWPAPWLFSLLVLPLGIIVGFNFTPLPLLLAHAGLPVDRIASISTIINLPAVLGVLIAPLVDTKLRRRTWIAIATFVTALSVCTYFPLIGAAHLRSMTALILVGGFPPFLIGAACGGMMSKLSQSAQSKAASWEMAGLLGGGAVAGALVIWLAARLPLAAVGVCLAVVIALPGFLSLAIPEPPPETSSWFRGRLRHMGTEAWSLIRSPARRWSTLLLVAPGGAGAAQSLLPAIAFHYGVGDTGVMWINGIGGGALLALGSLFGALIPGDWDRRLTYAAAGLTNALATCVLLAANRPATYCGAPRCT